MKKTLSYVIVTFFLINCNNDSNKLSPMFEFYDNGKLMFTGYYDSKGQKQDQYTSYYKSGKLKTKGFYKDDVPYGKWEVFYPSGQHKLISIKKEGKIDGEYLSYYETGNLKVEGYLIMGQYEKTWKWYHPNGQLKLIGDYKENKEQGEWVFYTEDGEISKIEVYNNGELLETKSQKITLQ